MDEIIIKLIKKKIQPSANSKTVKVLRELITFNVLTLWKSKEVMVWVVDAIRHGNRHTVIEIYNNVTFVVKLLVAEKAFEETLGHDSGDNGKTPNTDSFQKEMATLTGGIFLVKLYLSSMRKLEAGSVR